MEMSKAQQKPTRRTPVEPPKEAKSLSRPPEDREKIIKRILIDVNEYYETFGKGCPMKALSAKYSRALRGDFYDVIDDLTVQKEIEVELLEGTAARLVYPAKEKKKK